MGNREDRGTWSHSRSPVDHEIPAVPQSMRGTEDDVHEDLGTCRGRAERGYVRWYREKWSEDNTWSIRVE